VLGDGPAHRRARVATAADVVPPVILSGTRRRDQRVGRCDDIIKKARAAPGNLRFEEVLVLAECAGFVHARTKGSHHIFKRPGYMDTMNLQPGENGKAKDYQVRQVLKIYDDLAHSSEEL
jgi:predicted RNA binding protein YcfA (HicA-like mRNA interferase family)